MNNINTKEAYIRGFFKAAAGIPNLPAIGASNQPQTGQPNHQQQLPNQQPQQPNQPPLFALMKQYMQQNPMQPSPPPVPSQHIINPQPPNPNLPMR